MSKDHVNILNGAVGMRESEQKGTDVCGFNLFFWYVSADSHVLSALSQCKVFVPILSPLVPEFYHIHSFLSFSCSFYVTPELIIFHTLSVS